MKEWLGELNLMTQGSKRLAMTGWRGAQKLAHKTSLSALARNLAGVKGGDKI